MYTYIVVESQTSLCSTGDSNSMPARAWSRIRYKRRLIGMEVDVSNATLGYAEEARVADRWATSIVDGIAVPILMDMDTVLTGKSEPGAS